MIAVTALLLGATGSPARAVSAAEYQALRATLAVTPVDRAGTMLAQLPLLAGNVLEMEGTINGAFSSGDGSGYLLRVTSEQMVMLQAKANDPGMAVGNTVRVLARVPREGAILEHLALTPATSAPANVAVDDPVAVTPDEMVVDRRAPTFYHSSPKPAKEPPPMFSDAAGLAGRPEVVQLYAAKIKAFNTRLDDAVALLIAYHILEKSEANGIDPRLTMALIARESRFNPRAVSPAGAMGLGQLMPGTAAGLGVKDPFDIPSNIDGSVRYITAQLRAFGRLSLALAAYNAGPGAVRRYGGVPPYQETQNYVRLVWQTYAELAGLDPETGEKIGQR